MTRPTESGAEPASNTSQTGNPITKPDIDPPDTVPTKLIVSDRVEGSGSPAIPGDELAVEYFAVDETDKKIFSSWDETTPPRLNFVLGAREYTKGFDLGIEGMKVGGRREILIPGDLTERFGPLFYVVDLLEIKRDGRCWAVPWLTRPEYPAKCQTRTYVR